MIFIVTLCFDTFCFHYLANIYKILLIGFVLFLRRYVKYTLKKVKKAFIEQLYPFVYISVDKDHGLTIIMERDDFSYDNEVYEYIFMEGSINVTFEEFVEHYVDYYYLVNKECEGWVCTREKWNRITKSAYYILKDKKGFEILNEHGEEIRLPWPEKLNDKELKIRVKNILQLSLILKYYQATHNEDNDVKNLKILIFTNYFLCWCYILITSLPKLNDLQDLLEPFSELWL